jgi:serine/threonine protein kinase
MEVFQTPEGETYYLQKTVEGTSLREEIEKRKINETVFTEVEIIDIVTQIVCILCYAHQDTVAHSDLRPENILMQKKGVFLNNVGRCLFDDVV